jgi:hypothetical protein
MYGTQRARRRRVAASDHTGLRSKDCRGEDALRAIHDGVVSNPS